MGTGCISSPVCSDAYLKGTVNLLLDIISEQALQFHKYLFKLAMFLSTTFIFWLSTTTTMLLLELESTVT